MIALDTLRRWGTVLRLELMRESVFMACRVVIGYDDARAMVTLQDPSFGPAWEVSYRDFDRMWTFETPPPRPEEGAGQWEVDATRRWPAGATPGQRRTR